MINNVARMQLILLDFPFGFGECPFPRVSSVSLRKSEVQILSSPLKSLIVCRFFGDSTLVCPSFAQEFLLFNLPPEPRTKEDSKRAL